MKHINWVRIIRLLLGATLIGSAWYDHEPLFYLLGALFLIQGIFNLGCSNGVCRIPGMKETTIDKKEIEFEKVGE
ncbi:MAG: hypothetical protein K1X56_06405 [Flavobacteriales bacterium]|nr:hypothetical protein [Flavobacteriales bacterium]